MKKKKYAIVNERDEIIDHKPKKDIGKDDIIRVSALWMVDVNTGEILLTQRSFSEEHNQGKWGPAVAGTIEESESYEENIIKEIKEELGVSGLKLNKGPKIREGYFFLQWFICEAEKEKLELDFKDEEIIDLRWVMKDELINELKKHSDKFMKYSKETFSVFLRK